MIIGLNKFVGGCVLWSFAFFASEALGQAYDLVKPNRLSADEVRCWNYFVFSPVFPELCPPEIKLSLVTLAPRTKMFEEPDGTALAELRHDLLAKVYEDKQGWMLVSAYPATGGPARTGWVRKSQTQTIDPALLLIPHQAGSSKERAKAVEEVWPEFRRVWTLQRENKNGGSLSCPNPLPDRVVDNVVGASLPEEAVLHQPREALLILLHNVYQHCIPGKSFQKRGSATMRVRAGCPCNHFPVPTDFAWIPFIPVTGNAEHEESFAMEDCEERTFYIVCDHGAEKGCQPDSQGCVQSDLWACPKKCASLAEMRISSN